MIPAPFGYVLSIAIGFLSDTELAEILDVKW